MTQDRDPMEIGEGELQQLTAELHEMHHEIAMPALRNMAATTATRRTFLMGSGAALGIVALAACGKSSKSSGSTAAAGGTGQKLTGDLQIAAMAASLENLAVGTYDAGIKAATAGKLGTVPPAIVTFAQTAMKQHQDHADAWNAVLTGNGKKAVTVPDAAVKPTVDQGFAQVKDVAGLAKLALQLEDIAAATYLNGISVIQNKQALQTAATIHPVEMQHSAILNFVLGQYPVPNSFAKTDGARPPTDYTG